MSHKDEKEIIQKVKDILNYSSEEKQDIALQQFIRFNFTSEFEDKTITLPVKKRDGESFKFVEQYVKLVYELFKLKNDERISLYRSPTSLTKSYNNISQSINHLNKLIDKKKEYLSKIVDDKKNLLNIIISYLYNLINSQQETLFNKLDKFHFYFIFYVPSTCSLKFLLYSIIKNKFNDVLYKFNYKDFCPDFNNEICQNLIILFFENIKNEKRELLFIFAFLIYEYKVIFKYRLNQIIPKYILQHAAKKTYGIVMSKTLENGLIYEYTYNEYLSNLDNTIFLLEESNKKRANSSSNKSSESPIHNSQINHLNDNNNDNNNTQPLQNINAISISPISKGENKKLEEEEEKKNVPKNGEKRMDNNEINTSNLLLQIPEKKENNSSKEENANGKKIYEEKKDELKIERKEKTLENKTVEYVKLFNNQNGEEKLSENNNNSNIITSKKEEKRKDILNLSEQEIDTLNSRSLFILFKSKISELEQENAKKFQEQEKKFNEKEQENAKKFQEQEKKFNEQEQENAKKFQDQEKKFNEKNEANKKQFSELKSEIDNLKSIIGTIQIRGFAKNFLKIFKSDLSKEENEKIKKDKSKKGEVILESLKRIYSNYTNEENFKIVSEIVEKSGKTLNKGNEFAHSLDIKDYEEEVNAFKEKLNITFFDAEVLEKILFLIKIGISNSTFSKCFQFVSKYCGKEMKLAFLRSDDNIQTFIKRTKKKPNKAQ